MPPARFLPGAKSLGTPSDYTDAQWKALEGVKQKTPKLRFGAARPEFMNQVMLADGSISTDLEAVRAAAAAADVGDKSALEQFLAANKDAIVADTLPVKEKELLVRLRSAAAHNLVDELEAMIAEERFLFIVDVDLVPRIYFQCAVPGNPDVELADA